MDGSEDGQGPREKRGLGYYGEKIVFAPSSSAKQVSLQILYKKRFYNRKTIRATIRISELAEILPLFYDCMRSLN